MNRFALEPKVSVGRSKFRRPFSAKMAFDTGRLIPVYWDEVLPGDTLRTDVRFLIRSLPASSPVMDNAMLTVEWYFVPTRLVWEHWVNFCGENDTTAWANNYDYLVPVVDGQKYTSILLLSAPVNNRVGKTLYDYMGVPVSLFSGFGEGIGLADKQRIAQGIVANVIDLPFRAYFDIWNNYFRDQNYQEPILFSVGDSGTPSTVYDYCDEPLKVNKFHDYFTSVLPAPQKGDAVTIGVGGSAPIEVDFPTNFAFGVPQASISFASITDVDNKLLGIDPNNNHLIYQKYTNKSGGDVGEVSLISDTVATPTVSISGNFINSVGSVSGTIDLDNASSVTINALRAAFQMQRFYERAARYGTRYPEYLKANYGVTSPAAVLQRPELIASATVPINMDTVVANSATENQPLGSMAGYSKTGGELQPATKSFTEHGYIFCVACIRTEHSYSQGIEKKFLRRKLFDYYHQEFAHLGEQAVSTREINIKAFGDADTVFGYQEAWAEYRYSPNRVVGLMSPAVKGSLDMYTYADNFDYSLKSASADFMYETKDNVARTLADTTAPQWLADFYFDNTWVRGMPMYSTPGLIDHF